MRKTNLLGYAALSSLTLALASSPAYAQVDEIIVTATKRAENSQDIAVAVTALGEDFLEEQRVDVFTDYLLQLPSVNAASSGPGQGTIYIRGVASSAPTTTTAVAAGIAPNVALYLDEQPVSQVGRNLDVYAADLNRVEVLPGPQGTLFGASSQAGTIRLITNKPKIGVEEAKYSAGVSFTEGGEASYKLEATYNFPIGENTAIRATGFTDHQGGYIDNVLGTADIRNSALYRPGSVVRANGVAVGGAAGFVSGGRDLSLSVQDDPFFDGIVGGTADNSQFVEDNFNDTRYTGFRIAAAHEFNDDWKALVSVMGQEIDSDGVFFRDPELNDGNNGTAISRFADENLDDRFTNVAWNLEGRLGFLDFVYTGAFNNHDFDQRIDYTDYNLVGQYIPYYTCDYSVSGGFSATGTPVGTCNDPRLFADIENRTEVFTNELRFTTPSENRLRATGGGYISDQEVIERVDFTYPGSIAESVANGGVLSVPNAPIPGSNSTDPTARNPGVVFINDITRTDDQFGVFGEVSYDIIPDTLTFTGGARYYRTEVDFNGSSNNTTAFFGGADNARGFNLSDIFDGDNVVTSFFQGQGNQNANGVDTTLILSGAAEQEANLARILNGGGNGQLANQQRSLIANPVTPVDKAISDGFIFKANLSWTPVEDVLLYATWSQGFRPGTLNRPALQNPALIAAEVGTDDLTNYELGWKTRFLDNQLQFNGSAFYETITDLQSTIFAPSITNLLFSGNVADAEVLGIEADFIYAPATIEGLTLAGAVSILDTQITELLPGPAGGDSTIPIAPVGSSLAFAPSLQGNLRARYEWDSGDFTKHVSAQASYTSSSFSDVVLENRARQDSYFLLSGSAGLKKDSWGFEAFVDNITDERAEINNNFGFDRERQTINRPRTYGLRASYAFE